MNCKDKRIDVVERKAGLTRLLNWTDVMVALDRDEAVYEEQVMPEVVEVFHKAELRRKGLIKPTKRVEKLKMGIREFTLVFPIDFELSKKQEVLLEFYLKWLDLSVSQSFPFLGVHVSEEGLCHGFTDEYKRSWKELAGMYQIDDELTIEPIEKLGEPKEL